MGIEIKPNDHARAKPKSIFCTLLIKASWLPVNDAREERHACNAAQAKRLFIDTVFAAVFRRARNGRDRSPRDLVDPRSFLYRGDHFSIFRGGGRLMWTPIRDFVRLSA